MNKNRRTRLIAILPALLALGACNLFVDPAERIERAERYLASADYRSAMIELRQALKDEPGNARGHLLLAQAALQLADPAGAQHEVERARELGIPAAELAELAVQVHLAREQYRELLEQLDSGVIELPGTRRELYRGHALLGLKRPQEAALAYLAVLEADEKSAPARTGLAESLAAQGHFDEAMREIDTVLKANTEFAYAWLVRGAIYARRGQFEQAEQSLQTALEHAPRQLALQQRAGMLATLVQTKLARGDADSAQKAQERLQELVPDAPLTQFMAARIAMARQDYPGATAQLHRLLNATPGFVPGRFLLGAALIAQESFEQAETHLSQVVREAPANIEARKLLAEVRLKLGRPEAAMQVLVPALESRSDDPQVRVLLNEAQTRLAEDPVAIDFLERSVATHPDNDELKVSLAAAYLRNGEREKALEVLQRTRGQARLALARLYLREKKTRQAGQVVAQVLKEAPDRMDIVSLVGMLYLEAGYYDRALAYLRQAADREPGNSGYWLNVARAQLALNQLAAARESTGRALELEPDWPPAVALAAMLDVTSGEVQAAIDRVVALRQKNPDDAGVALLEGDIRMAAHQPLQAAEAYAISGRLRPSATAALKTYRARAMAKAPDPEEPLRNWLERQPDDLGVRFALAEAYQESRPELAIAEYERILGQAPKNAVALNNLAWLYQTTGDERALETARRAYELAPASPAVADTYGWILLQKGQVAEAARVLKAAAQASDDPRIKAHYQEALARL